MADTSVGSGRQMLFGWGLNMEGANPWPTLGQAFGAVRLWDLL